MCRNSFFFILISLLITSCQPSRTGLSEKPTITVSILPYQYFVKQLAGDRYIVNVLVPPGANHHAYEPTPRQLQEVEKSTCLFTNGYLGFEQVWIPKIQSTHPDINVVDLSRQVSLYTIPDAEGEAGHPNEPAEPGHSHDGPDPHYWLSVREAKAIAREMAAGLIQAEPADESLIQQNLKILLDRIDSLDQQISSHLVRLKHRSFIIFHPALNYLARDYNLVQYSMEAGGKEPTAAHFKELVDQASAQGINTIFIQKEYDQENAVTLAREIHARIVVIDPMSGDWMNEIVRIVRELSLMDQ